MGGVNLSCDLEIYFDEKYIFPYKYLDYITQDNDISVYNNFAIYLIMSTAKLKITSAVYNADEICITYRNEKTGKIYTIINKIFPIQIPSNYISININKSKYSVIIKLTENSYDFLVDNKIEPQIAKLLISKGLKIDIYALIMRNDNVFLNEFSLLYIGQSRNLIRRLTSHKTIQKIVRDCTLEYEESEIFIMLMHPKAKRIDSFEIPKLSLQGHIGQSSTNDGNDLIENIDSSEILDAAEIMLIQAFRPKYNIMHKNANPSKKQKKYTKFYDANIKNICVSFDLEFECDTINLRTETLDTQNCFGLMLKCQLTELSNNDEVDIEIDYIGNGKL